VPLKYSFDLTADYVRMTKMADYVLAIKKKVIFGPCLHTYHQKHNFIYNFFDPWMTQRRVLLLGQIAYLPRQLNTIQIIGLKREINNHGLTPRNCIV